MSIKSQKSLLEECSEIIEKSYSVRSASDESLSCDDEDECLARELMKNMTPAVLSKLRRCFKKNKERSKAQDIDRRVEEVMRAAAAEEGIEFAETASAPPDSLWLNENDFVSSLNSIFGHHKYTTHAHKLFHLLDGFNSGKVWWGQLIDRLVAIGAKKTTTRAETWKPLTEYDIKRLEHCKRETLVKLVCVEREDSFCYVAVSRGGRVGVYSGDFCLLKSYEMFYHRSGVHGRVKNRWITDAIYLPDVQYLIMSASDRSLSVYDATTLTHTPLYCITGLPNIPTCMAYTPSSHTSDTSELAFGTELGDVTLIRFLQPKVQLLHTKTPDAINYYYWMVLLAPPHTSHCSIRRWRRVHSRSVRRVAYSRGGDILVTCAHDATASLRIRHVPAKMDDYVFKVLRGVSCFHIVSALQVVATGGCEGVVRLWAGCARAPFAALTTHAHARAAAPPAVLDVAIIAALDIVIAFCNNCTLYIWDLYEECLLQSIKIRFPFLRVLGKKVEFGTYCIHPGPVRRDKEEEDESESEVPVVMSRRASSVYQGSTGGLMLQPDSQNDWDKRGLEDEPEYVRWSRGSVVLSCCDSVCVLQLWRGGGGGAGGGGALLPPPADTLRVRRPSAWDLPDYCATTTSCTTPRTKPSAVPTPQLLSPSTAEFPLTDLDTLLENAGLQGILEKDFVLMQGLKNDLNIRLAEMEENKQVMMNVVTAGAPYLALKTHDPCQVDPVDEMLDKYKHVMRLFPGTSVTGTPRPGGSEKSTPRNNVNVEEFFKFYSDNSYHDDKYKPLTEQDYNRFISTRASRREPALTRQITSLAYNVGKRMISLAEGMPNEQVFPFRQLTLDMNHSNLLLEGKDLAAALQYVPSQGLPALVSELRKFQFETHRPPELPRDILVTNGGQHGIYQCVELLVEPGDPVITTEYAYTGIHSTLKPYQPEIISIPEDEDGMLPETLDSVLGERLRRGHKMPKMLYIIPTGNNPTGTVLPEERRRQIYELACKYDFLIVEDDPYMFLNYTDRRAASFLSLDSGGRVVRVDSVSKLVSAGLRAAWLTAPAPLLRAMELHTQAELLHSCTLAQAILLQLIQNRQSFASHLWSAREFYRHRRDALHSALQPIADIAPHTLPHAGLFFWIRVNGVEDVYNMVFHTAFQRGLMLVPGQAFLYDSSAPCQHLRLTFSKIRHEDMDVAVRILSEIIREEQQRTLQKPKRVATEG